MPKAIHVCFQVSVLVVLITGCASQREQAARVVIDMPPRHGVAVLADGARNSVQNGRDSEIRLVSAQEELDEKPELDETQELEITGDEDEPGAASDTPEDPDSEDSEDSEDLESAAEPKAAGPEPVDTKAEALELQSVINSVHNSFPLVEAAYRETDIANGKVIASQGEFDTKLKASSENGPTGFYQTYRQKAGVTQPLFNGGEVFAGYRIGRGDFEPWYEERETNGGGEFKVGGSIPLLRNRDIDARRAALWRAEYDVQIAQPEIRGQLIVFAYDAAIVYWKWVAEGRKYFAERDWLELAADRNQKIEFRVKVEELDPPELTDNKRAIAKRKAKVADQLRKVQQAAVKLSLYLRDANGNPIVPTLDQLPAFPDPVVVDGTQIEVDIALALSQRPDLQTIRLKQERLQVDYDEASNLGLPRLDAYIAAGQDVGLPTSSKRDKSEFELDAGVFFDLPVQRLSLIHI